MSDVAKYNYDHMTTTDHMITTSHFTDVPSSTGYPRSDDEVSNEVISDIRGLPRMNTVQCKILAGENFDEIPLFEILTNAPVQWYSCYFKKLKVSFITNRVKFDEEGFDELENLSKFPHQNFKLYGRVDKIIINVIILVSL